MDPLSIAASIAGLATLAAALSGKICDSAGGAKELKTTLDGLQNFLATIGGTTPALKKPLKDLNDTLLRLEKRLQEKQGRWGEFWKQGEVAGFVQEIEGRKSTLQIAMQAGNG